MTGKPPAVFDDDFEGALERFPLEPWLDRHGFEAQGRGKKEWVADCHYCGAEDKLSVNPRERYWRCFVCQRQFTLLDLIAHYEGGYATAVSVVRVTAGGRSLAVIGEDWRVDESDERHPLWQPEPIAPPQSFTPLTGHTPYTAARGLDLENMVRIGAGVCSRGRYSDRLVFPARRWFDGAWIYFQARAMWEKRDQPPDDDGKVRYRKNLNPDVEHPERFAEASDVLLGYELLNGATRVALVEGPTDWVQMDHGAVALLGKNLSARQLMLLVQAGIREIDLCLDPDAWDKPTRKMLDGTVVELDRPPPAVKVAQACSAHFVVNAVRYPRAFDPGAYSPRDNRLWRASAQRWGDGARLAFIP